MSVVLAAAPVSPTVRAADADANANAVIVRSFLIIVPSQLVRGTVIPAAMRGLVVQEGTITTSLLLPSIEINNYSGQNL